MEHTTSKTSPLTCPYCEASNLKDIGRNAARCGACNGVLGGELLDLLREISTLPNPPGRHACECGHPEMRLLPGGVYRCPACGSEVLPLSAANVSWIEPERSDAYRQGWLDGRYGGPELLTESRLLARWEGHDRLDFYRGRRAGREARPSKGRLMEAS